MESSDEAMQSLDSCLDEAEPTKAVPGGELHPQEGHIGFSLLSFQALLMVLSFQARNEIGILREECSTIHCFMMCLELVLANFNEWLFNTGIRY